jgi:hypothetical protein
LRIRKYHCLLDKIEVLILNIVVSFLGGLDSSDCARTDEDDDEGRNSAALRTWLKRTGKTSLIKYI